MRVALTRRVFALVLVAILSMSTIARAQPADTGAAEQAVTDWLVLVDQGAYAESWTGAAAAFKQAVTQQQWQKAVQAVRQPLGAVKSRAMKSATPTKTLPGAPDGQYVVVQYDSTFESKASAVETVTAILEPDGTWHVGGYFIR